MTLTTLHNPHFHSIFDLRPTRAVFQLPSPPLTLYLHLISLVIWKLLTLCWKPLWVVFEFKKEWEREKKRSQFYLLYFSAHYGIQWYFLILFWKGSVWIIRRKFYVHFYLIILYFVFISFTFSRVSSLNMWYLTSNREKSFSYYISICSSKPPGQSREPILNIGMRFV